MRLSEIRKKYRDQWVLVEYSKPDKELRVKDGKVLRTLPAKKTFTKPYFSTKAKT